MGNILEIIAPGIIPGIIAVAALVITRRDKTGDLIRNLDHRLTDAINDLSQRVARIEGHLFPPSDNLTDLS